MRRDRSRVVGGVIRGRGGVWPSGTDRKSHVAALEYNREHFLTLAIALPVCGYAESLLGLADDDVALFLEHLEGGSPDLIDGLFNGVLLLCNIFLCDAGIERRCQGKKQGQE